MPNAGRDKGGCQRLFAREIVRSARAHGDGTRGDFHAVVDQAGSASPGMAAACDGGSFIFFSLPAVPGLTLAAAIAFPFLTCDYERL